MAGATVGHSGERPDLTAQALGHQRALLEQEHENAGHQQ
jgi:hypothetical protein